MWNANVIENHVWQASVKSSLQALHPLIVHKVGVELIVNSKSYL